jgi:shikimate dehydrogenase
MADMELEYGLAGGHLGHSHSPRIHEMLGVPGYELVETSPEGLRGLLERRAFLGLNVTIPYKVDAFGLCDTLSEEARLIGSVNTLIVDGEGRLQGHNTDLFGLEEMARRAGIALTGRKAAILGSGGASRTAQAAARRLEAREVVVVSRSGPIDYARLKAEHADVEVILNTTPVGMYPENGANPIDLADFPQCAGVLDMIYNPFRTALLLQAQARGIPHADGLRMLIAQAWLAARLFLGRGIEAGRMDEIEETLRLELNNLVLVGMPGSGKTSVGQSVAKRLKRTCVDLDAWIERRAGQTIPEIFEERGEDAFRALEREAAAEAGMRQGLVIATGGGTVLAQENVDALRQNGVLIGLRRPLEALATTGRPLSTGPEVLEAMAEQRMPVYEAVCQAWVDNTRTHKACVEAVVQAFQTLVG